MDVGVWLGNLGLGQYEAAFRENAIDGDVLLRLTVDDLKDLGVTIVGHRRKLLDAIAALNSLPPTQVTPSSLASPPSTPAQKTPEVGAERRPVTVMFCDLVGSTALASRLDAEDWRNLVSGYLDAASEAVTQMGGRVATKLGDGLMALFGHPIAQENDSERAVRAALAIQRALAELNRNNAGLGRPKLVARIGIESGAVVVDAAGEIFGDAPNSAARVQTLADPGTVLITARVQRQVAGLFIAEDRGLNELKGVPTPVALYRIVRASGGRRFGARALTALAGRQEELDLLRRRWERAVTGEGQLALVVGEPGIGKSRLVEEFRLKIAATPHTWAEFSSSQLLQNTPLHPIAEWGRQRFGADEPAARRLADLENTLRLIGLDASEYTPLLAPLVDVALPEERAAKLAPEELRHRQLAALTTWFLAGARSQPAALAFEDLHWADPTSLDLMQALAERGRTASLFIIATARPEFHPPWSLRSHHSVISLSPLAPADVAQMVGELAARHALSKEVVDGVSERTGGVPLFVEEVTRLLLERGEAGGSQAIPPTLQQSLAARLDRLGDAREVAQIGAVLGQDFAYALVRAVGGVDDSALQSALDRLVEADLLVAVGAGQEAFYRFKHTLIQEAAYDSLLKSRRQALHRRAAEVLRDEAERAGAAPEVIAHHFTGAGLDDQAVEWWGKAGDQALRRSAFQEAIAHLGKAIAMADKSAGPASERELREAASSRRLKLQADYGQAVMWSKGYAADEANAAFARAGELAASTDGSLEHFSSSYGQLLGRLLRGEYREAEYIARRLLHEAETANRGQETAQARNAVGQICLYQGKVHEAQTAFEGTLVDWRLVKDSAEPLQPWIDPGTMATSNLAHVAWLAGDPARARRLSEQAIQRANELGHAQTRAQTLLLTSLFETLRNDPAAALRSTDLLLGLARKHGMELYAAFGGVYSAWAQSRLSFSRAGAGVLQQAIADYVQPGNRTALPFFLGLLAERQADAQDTGSAIATIDEALAGASETGERLANSFLHRLRGDILLKRDSADPAPGEDAYRTAIAIAKHQGARSYDLLASLSLAKLYQSTGRANDAHAVLAPALEGFWPTPEMPEIGEAQSLLAALAETDQVKAEAARRQQRRQLHVAYGNALFAARGPGAPETAQAFARAHESAVGDNAAHERLSADFGLWVGSYVRGELAAMREHSTAFLGDVEARPHSPEAGVAHRMAGITHWFAGEYVEAREHTEHALALFQPGRDDDLAFRFGHDAGVAAMLCLALILWPLGDIGRAVSLIGDAEARSAGLAHIATRAHGKQHAALFELMRGDISRVAPNAIELARLAREHDLPHWRAYGVFFEGVASAESGVSLGGLDEVRHGAKLLRDRNAQSFDGLIQIALSEAEARAGDVNRPLAILDETLATCERTGHRAFEAELHRVRGEMLLRRDPANPAPAELALLTAIAVAKSQATRSFELRAALALSKLYQATARPAEARAILSSALEGFAPAAEMPEIAEAQALMESLA